MPRPGRVDQGAGRRARDEDPRQVEQQRRVLVAARVQAGQRHQQFAAAQVGVADQVEGGIGRDEAVACRTSAADARRSARITRSISASRGARPRLPAPAAGAGCAELDGRPAASATGAPIAAQSGVGSSRARTQRVAQRAEPRLVAQFGQPGRGAAAGAAPDCRARSGRTCRDGGRRRGISAAGDRRRRTATGRPSGRSARGRRRRRCV